MKHCDKCNVDVNTTHTHCPLCFNEIKGENTTPLMYSVSEAKPNDIQKTHKARKILALISIAVIAICAVINYLTKTPFWSGIVAASIVYVWIFVKHTIMSHRSAFEKILLQVLSVIGLLLITNYVSGGGWFVEYVLPALLTIVVVILDFMLFISKRRRQLQVSFILIEVLVLIISIIFVILNAVSFKLMHIITLITASLSILGVIIMDGKNLFQEISKKFHL